MASTPSTKHRLYNYAIWPRRKNIKIIALAQQPPPPPVDKKAPSDSHSALARKPEQPAAAAALKSANAYAHQQKNQELGSNNPQLWLQLPTGSYVPGYQISTIDARRCFLTKNGDSRRRCTGFLTRKQMRNYKSGPPRLSSRVGCRGTKKRGK